MQLIDALVAMMRALLLPLLAPVTVALAPPKIYFDVATSTASLGRIEIALSSFELLPRLCENVRLIASGERAPRCSFENARFADAREGPQYKWSHQFACAHSAIELGLLKGDASSANREEAFGGVYYGAAVGDGDVALTTPLAGPGAYTRFAFVRVGASPTTWKQRLLANAAVLGVATTPLADDVLHRLATADGGGVVAGAGVVDDAADDDCLVPPPEELESEDCLWDAGQERAWWDRRFLQAEKEGFRDPARGNSGTQR